MDLKYISLNHINLDTNQIIQKEVNLNDASNYIDDIITTIFDTKSKRQFYPSDDSEVYLNVLDSINLNIENKKLSQCEIAATLSSEFKHKTNSLDKNSNKNSKKLLKSQKIAQEKYGHLNDIKKGSLIQALVEDDSKNYYVLCLIEHNDFLDEDDLKLKGGLPTSDTAALKSCIFSFENTDLRSVFLTDSSPKIADYWFNSFLELQETRSDLLNTKNAYNNIFRIIRNRFSKNYKADFSKLQNALRVYFLQKKAFDYKDCVNFLFEDYEPEEPTNPDFETIDTKEMKEIFLKSIEKDNDFDSKFQIDIKDIKNQLNKPKYKLNNSVTLQLNNTSKHLEDFFYSCTIDGENVLIIKNIDTSTYDKFNFNYKNN